MPVAVVTNDDQPGHFPEIDRVKHSTGLYYQNLYDSNIILPCQNLLILQNLTQICLIKVLRCFLANSKNVWVS